MGWSCRADAAETMDKIRATGLFVGKQVGDDEFFVEVSNREFADGHISCKVMKFTSGRPEDASRMAVKVASFQIAPDGGLPKAPKWLKAMVGAQ